MYPHRDKVVQSAKPSIAKHILQLIGNAVGDTCSENTKAKATTRNMVALDTCQKAINSSLYDNVGSSLAGAPLTAYFLKFCI